MYFLDLQSIIVPSIAASTQRWRRRFRCRATATAASRAWRSAACSPYASPTASSPGSGSPCTTPVSQISHYSLYHAWQHCGIHLCITQCCQKAVPKTKVQINLPGRRALFREECTNLRSNQELYIKKNIHEEVHFFGKKCTSSRKIFVFGTALRFLSLCHIFYCLGRQVVIKVL